MQTLHTEFRCDTEKLLRAVSPGDPTGASLRYDAVYDRIRELRREDDATLPQGVWKTDQKQADWAAVASLCLDVLETRSKDLQIAAWLTEAWLHLYGFSGTAAGFELLHALCERYWEELHPRIEAHDPDFRNAPLIWLNRKLPVKLKLRPITAPQSGDVALFSWADWELACQAEHAPSKAQPREELKQGLSLAAFQQSVRLTPAPYLHGLLDQIELTMLHCGKLESLLDEKLQKDSPGLVAVRSTSEDIAGLLSSLLRERTTLGTSEELAHLAAHMQESGESEAIYPQALIRTRGEAYALLAEIADFLEQTEPHSPTPHLLRRAVNWGSLPFAQLLPELIRNQSELAEISRLLSLKTSSATNG